MSTKSEVARAHARIDEMARQEKGAHERHSAAAAAIIRRIADIETRLSDVERAVDRIVLEHEPELTTYTERDARNAKRRAAYAAKRKAKRD